MGVIRPAIMEECEEKDTCSFKKKREPGLCVMIDLDRAAQGNSKNQKWDNCAVGNETAIMSIDFFLCPCIIQKFYSHESLRTRVHFRVSAQL